MSADPADFSDEQQFLEAGLEPRYEVKKIRDPEGKHDRCRYFVLDPQHDPIARVALQVYSELAEKAGHGSLAIDLNAWLAEVGVGSAAEGRQALAELRGKLQAEALAQIKPEDVPEEFRGTDVNGGPT